MEECHSRFLYIIMLWGNVTTDFAPNSAPMRDNPKPRNEEIENKLKENSPSFTVDLVQE